MIKRNCMICILVVLLCLAGCTKGMRTQEKSVGSADSIKETKAGQAEPGKALEDTIGGDVVCFVMQADEDTISTPTINLDGQDHSFVFTYDVLSSYLSLGTYEIENNRLIAETDDGNYKFVFEIVDKSHLKFLQKPSSEIKLTDSDYGVKLNDKAVFAMKENPAPTETEVSDMRGKALEGMNDNVVKELKEAVKMANESLEQSVVYDDLFEKLSDPECLEWNLLDQKGNMQIGWAFDEGIEEYDSSSGMTYEEYAQKYGEPVVVYNEYTAEDFIDFFEGMRASLGNDLLEDDFNHLVENMELARKTHDVKYMEQVYYILHDMDYFLLRYGIEDVGKYISDMSMVSTYYGALEIYK